MIGRFKLCYRCSTCGISYPVAGDCQVCGGKTDRMSEEADKDWKEKVALMKAEPPEIPAAEKEYGWRMSQLVYAGAPIVTAELLAADRAIDLHRAVDLIRKAGPGMAARILL